MLKSLRTQRLKIISSIFSTSTALQSWLSSNQTARHLILRTNSHISVWTFCITYHQPPVFSSPGSCCHRCHWGIFHLPLALSNCEEAKLLPRVGNLVTDQSCAKKGNDSTLTKRCIARKHYRTLKGPRCLCSAWWIHVMSLGLVMKLL